MNPTIQRVTYIDATETREHLNRLDKAGVSGYALAKATGVNQSTISRLLRGLATSIRSDNAAILCATEAGDIAQPVKPVPTLDPAVLKRILAGDLEHRIANRDKPAYVRALAEHGWKRSHIAARLHLSGSTVRKILDTQAAA